MTDTHKIAVVLAAGGDDGAYQAGMLPVLLEHLHPRPVDIWCGSSVGALGTLFMAQAPRVYLTQQLMAASYRRLWQRLRRRDVYRMRTALKIAFGEQAARRENWVM